MEDGKYALCNPCLSVEKLQTRDARLYEEYMLANNMRQINLTKSSVKDKDPRRP